ncbi:acid phosphatase [Glycomyces tarimensis]
MLIRHGETTWSASGQHTSVTDLEITEKGVAQAKALAPMLGHWDFTAVWSSPRKRATQTAEVAGLPITDIKPDLVEWAYGDYEGMTSEEIREADPEWTLWTAGGKGPGGESAAQVEERLDRVLDEARELLDQGDVAFFAHGHSLRAVAARWLGRPARDGREFTIETASIAALGFEHGRPAIALWNLTPELANIPIGND